MQQLRIKFISGSLRKDSFNTRLALYAATVAAELGLEPEVLTLNAFPMPLLNQDEEAEFGAPEAAVALKGKLLRSDCLVLVCPEYNGSMTAALKNAIDWLSRPATQPAGNVFAGKWVALMAASPGALGGAQRLDPGPRTDVQPGSAGIARAVGACQGSRSLYRRWFSAGRLPAEQGEKHTAGADCPAE